MIINPVIIAAVVVQSIVAGTNAVAGAVLGFVITTGILFWGMSVYADGGQMAFFGIPLSQHAFFVGCALWYGFDAKEFMAATAQAGEETVPAAADEQEIQQAA